MNPAPPVTSRVVIPCPARNQRRALSHGCIVGSRSTSAEEHTRQALPLLTWHASCCVNPGASFWSGTGAPKRLHLRVRPFVFLRYEKRRCVACAACHLRLANPDVNCVTFANRVARNVL